MTETANPQGTDNKQSGRMESALATARGATNDALHETRKVAERAGKAIETNPLAVVAGGIAIGLAAGALLPKTKRETELLGAAGKRLTGVGDDQLPVGLVDRLAGRHQRRELFVIVTGNGDTAGEDRRVRGDAADPVGDHIRQGAVTQGGTGEVVQPRALPEAAVEGFQSGHGVVVHLSVSWRRSSQ